MNATLNPPAIAPQTSSTIPAVPKTTRFRPEKNIPEFRFMLGATRSQPASGENRLKITFPALSFLTYNVRYRSSAQLPWTTVTFSKFVTGPLIQTDYLGTGADADIFVAAPHPAGFFSVVAI